MTVMSLMNVVLHPTASVTLPMVIQQRSVMMESCSVLTLENVLTTVQKYPVVQM